MSKVKQYRILLSVIRSADPKLRAAIIKSAPDGFIKAFIELALNTLAGNLKMPVKMKQQLAKHKIKLRHFADHRGKRGVANARKALNQKGGIIPFLLPLLGLAGIGTAIGTAAAAPTIAAKAAKNATSSALDAVEERAKKYINKI